MKLDVSEGFNAKVDNNVANAISLTCPGMYLLAVDRAIMVNGTSDIVCRSRLYSCQ